jgi:lysophospholipase L1-like esterase
MQKAFFAATLLAVVGGLPLLGILVGYQLASRRAAERPWQSNDLVNERVEFWQQSSTLAGAFQLAGRSTEGIADCYFIPPDLNQVTWVGHDMPTPFVGYAPMPGPLPNGHINAQQFRYRRDLATPKPPRTCRLFVVGGSTAFGAGASSNETNVAGYLERILNSARPQWDCQFEVVTAAACAWCSTHERILIENRLVDFQPDIVVALSGCNDAFWATSGAQVQWFRSFQDQHFFLLTNAMLSANFGQHFPDLVPPGPAVTPEQSTVRLLANVRLACMALQSANADYLFALQPVFPCSRKTPTAREAAAPSLIGGEDMRTRFAQFRQALADENSANFHFVDLSRVFDDLDGSTEVFLDSCHFGDRGNERIAKALADALTPLLNQRLKPTLARQSNRAAG